MLHKVLLQRDMYRTLLGYGLGRSGNCSNKKRERTSPFVELLEILQECTGGGDRRWQKVRNTGVCEQTFLLQAPLP